eukprot:m.34427 g.34427  ORF g.34427 m.34427 type:complete len:527 (+) comp31980_c0_seq4:80-1660(+)
MLDTGRLELAALLWVLMLYGGKSAANNVRLEVNSARPLEGSEVILPCHGVNALISLPAFRYNGTVFTNAIHMPEQRIYIDVSTDGSGLAYLVIRNARTSDSGPYSCSQSVTGPWSDPVTLVVIKPKFGDSFPKGPILGDVGGGGNITISVVCPGCKFLSASLSKTAGNRTGLKGYFQVHDGQKVVFVLDGPGKYAVLLMVPQLPTLAQRSFMVIERVSPPSITEMKLINFSTTVVVSFKRGPSCHSGFCDSPKGFWMNIYPEKKNSSAAPVKLFAEVNKTSFATGYSLNLVNASVYLVASGSLGLSQRSKLVKIPNLKDPRENDASLRGAKPTESEVTPERKEERDETAQPSSSNNSHNIDRTLLIALTVTLPSMIAVLIILFIFYSRRTAKAQRQTDNSIDKLLQSASYDDIRRYDQFLVYLETAIQDLQEQRFGQSGYFQTAAAVAATTAENHAVLEEFQQKTQKLQCACFEDIALLFSRLDYLGKSAGDSSKDVLAALKKCHERHLQVIKELRKKFSRTPQSG